MSLHFSSAEMSCPLSWRLDLPAAWVENAARKAAGKIPAAIIDQTKNALALELIDQALCWELPRLPVVAVAASDNDFAFRAALRERGLE